MTKGNKGNCHQSPRPSSPSSPSPSFWIRSTWREERRKRIRVEREKLLLFPPYTHPISTACWFNHSQKCLPPKRERIPRKNSHKNLSEIKTRRTQIIESILSLNLSRQSRDLSRIRLCNNDKHRLIPSQRIAGNPPAIYRHENNITRHQRIPAESLHSPLPLPHPVDNTAGILRKSNKRAERERRLLSELTRCIITFKSAFCSLPLPFYPPPPHSPACH